MRILMLNNEYPPLGGGTASVTAALLREYAKNDALEIDLLTSSGTGETRIAEFSSKIRIYYLPVKVQCLHHASNRELLLYAMKAALAARKLHAERRYDVCLAFSTVPAGAAAWALYRLAGLPYVVRVTGPDIPGFEARYNSIYPLLKPVIRKVWATGKAVVVKCAEESDLARRTLQIANYIEVKNGVDCDLFTPQYAKPSRPFVQLLCVARLIQRKGQIHLFHVMKRLISEGRSVKLALVGDGDEEVAYRAEVQRLGIAEHVEFMGYVPRERMPDVYRNADIFVLPSANEGMSIALLEAMASGLPVVTTHTGGADELLRGGDAGRLFPYGDDEKLHHVLVPLIEDPEKRRALAERARQRAEDLSWNRAGERILAILEGARQPSGQDPVKGHR